MAKTTSLFLTKNFANPCVTFLPADTTAKKNIYTATGDDAVVKVLSVVSTDSTAANVQLWLYDGVSDRLLGTIGVPLLSGSNGSAPAIDALNGVLIPGLGFDQNGKRVLGMKAGYILKASLLATLTAAKELHIVGVVEEY